MMILVSPMVVMEDNQGHLYGIHGKVGKDELQ